MNDLKKLKTTAAIVREVLEEHPPTRNDDEWLYFHVCMRINPNCVEMPLATFLASRWRLGVPPFESVRRSRQKIQREFPHLASAERTKQARTENESEYRSFARLKGDIDQWLK